ETSTISLHDALPISPPSQVQCAGGPQFLSRPLRTLGALCVERVETNEQSTISSRADCVPGCREACTSRGTAFSTQRTRKDRRERNRKSTRLKPRHAT